MNKYREFLGAPPTLLEFVTALAIIVALAIGAWAP